MHPELERLGWNDVFERNFEPHGRAAMEPARVIAQHRGAFVLSAAGGEAWAECSGRLRHAAGPAELPAVGDWVAMFRSPGEGRAVIHAVLPRTTRISRKVAGFRTDEQVLAANVDVVLIVAALNAGRLANRMERALALGWESGAEPVILLTKADLCCDPAAGVAPAEEIAFGARIIVTSAATGQGVGEVAALLAPARTGALLGPSGVGKSSVINRLCGEVVQEARAVRESDGRGRHTTTARELILLPGGGSIIDSPGLREIQLWSEGGVERAFNDIAELAPSCRFRNCAHRHEPGCAVLAAVEEGLLDATRLDRYRKIEREVAFLERRKDRRAAMEERRRWKRISKASRQAKPR